MDLPRAPNQIQILRKVPTLLIVQEKYVLVVEILDPSPCRWQIGTSPQWRIASLPVLFKRGTTVHIPLRIESCALEWRFDASCAFLNSDDQPQGRHYDGVHRMHTIIMSLHHRLTSPTIDRAEMI